MSPAVPASPSLVALEKRVGDLTHLLLTGAVEDSFALRRTGPVFGPVLLVDLSGVTRITSSGVRRWMEFFRTRPAGARDVFLLHVPPVVVDQLNMVEGFAGVASVLSVLAPYQCRRCREERLCLVDLDLELTRVSEGKVPAQACCCGQSMDFSEVPQAFFDFARRQTAPRVEPGVARYVTSLRMGLPEDSLGPLKFFQGDLTFVSLPSTLGAGLSPRGLSAGLEGRVVYDGARVATLEDGAPEALLGALSAAARAAHVELSRASIPLVNALAQAPQLPQVALASLWLPCECRSCGHQPSQAIPAAGYLASLKRGERLERRCSICGASAFLPGLQFLTPLLSRMDLTSTASSEVGALELSLLKTLVTAGQPTATPSDAGGEATAPLRASPLRLHVLRKLGQGGMAEVFLAKQAGEGGFEKYVVMKKVLDEYAERPDFVEMLFAEARANARLTHPNIVQTFDVGTANGSAYLIMEYVRGPDLKKLMTLMRRTGATLPIAHALRIAADTAAGLHFAHSYVDPEGQSHPIIHRDVSPHNILISLDGAIKLSDFGIATVVGEEVERHAGQLKGKLSYLSPEAVSFQPLDARNDVFALGVVLFELLCGTHPFRRGHEQATLRALQHEPTPRPDALRPEIPADVAELVLRATAKEPSARTGSAGVLREELELAMAKHGLASSPSSVAHYFVETLGEALSEYRHLVGAGRPMPQQVTSAEELLSGTRTMFEPKEEELEISSSLELLPAWELPPEDEATPGPAARAAEPRR